MKNHILFEKTVKKHSSKCLVIVQNSSNFTCTFPMFFFGLVCCCVNGKMCQEGGKRIMRLHLLLCSCSGQVIKKCLNRHSKCSPFSRSFIPLLLMHHVHVGMPFLALVSFPLLLGYTVYSMYTVNIG